MQLAAAQMKANKLIEFLTTREVGGVRRWAAAVLGQSSGRCHHFKTADENSNEVSLLNCICWRLKAGPNGCYSAGSPDVTVEERRFPA